MPNKKSSNKNQPKRIRYNQEKRWRTNKIEKISRHLKKYGEKDTQTIEALKKVKELTWSRRKK